MKKNYHSFSFVLRKLLDNPDKHTCVFEQRPKKYKFGTHNYGEIPKWYNHADGDPWDIFAPGYNNNLMTNKPYYIDKIVGVFVLEDGNHKIAVRLKNIPIHSKQYEQNIIDKYIKNYSGYTKIKGVYMSPRKLEQTFL